MRVFLKQCLCTLFVLIAASGMVAAKPSIKDLPPHYRHWIQDEVNFIITNEERDAFLALPNDETRDKFIEHFWELRNPTPGAPTNTYKDDIYQRIEYAKQYLGGVHTDMGQTYVTLGEPKQRSKYYGRQEVRPMEIWFYQNTNPALPPYFNVLFFDKDSNGSMHFYSPYMDGPGKLATSVMTVNDNKHALQNIDRALGREVARTTLSLLPDEPVDMQNATTSLTSDVMIGTIKGLANHPLTKDELNLRRATESVTHRIVLGEDYLDVVTATLRDGTGNFNLHYLLRLHRPSDFSIAEADNKFFYNVELSARVYGPDNKLIFKQDKDISQYLDAGDVERIKKSLFGYEGWLALAPGKYKVNFLLTNKVTKTAYKAERTVVIPNPVTSGVRLSEVVPFSSAETGRAGQGLPAVYDWRSQVHADNRRRPHVFAGTEPKRLLSDLGAPADPRSFAAKNLTVDYAYGRVGASGDARNVHEEVAKSQLDSFGSLLTGKKIALPMEAAGGSYRLLVSLNDPDSTQKVYSSLNFRVSNQGDTATSFDITDPDLAQDVTKGVPQFDRALAYMAQGDKDSALAWFKTAIARDPANEIARSRLAELYFAKQDYANVAELFSRSPVTPETDEQAILQGAESMAKTGSVSRAITLLEGAINQRSKSGPLYMALAGYYRSEGKADRATELESKGRELIKE